MIVRPAVTVDGRDQEAILRDLERRRPGYVPTWQPGPQDPGRAIELIAARFAAAVLQRLNQSTENNKLAFLDTLGERLSPARPARAPIVFQLANGAAGGTVPAGTSVAAPPPPGSSAQTVFETETAAGITAGKLVEVFSLWPGRDEYIDHSADFVAGSPIGLFDPQKLTTIPHHLYLSHPVLLNLSGNVVLLLEFQLLHAAADPLGIAWEYWDGQVWREFAALDPGSEPKTQDPDDGTRGLTGSGAIKLMADCAKSDKTVVNGVQGYFIRGRLTQPLPPDPARPLPEVEGIRISSLVNQPMIGRLTGSAHLALRSMRRGIGFASIGDGPDQPPLTGVLKNEAGQALGQATVVISAPEIAGFGERSAVTDANGKFSIVLDEFSASRKLQFDVTFLAARAGTSIAVPSNTAAIELTFKLSALVFDKAFNDATKLDTTKPFYPFGQQPQPGTVFYFANKEIFSKPGARFRIYLPRTSAPSDKLGSAESVSGIQKLDHMVAWEYWNGREWTELPGLSAAGVAADFVTSEILDFAVPVDMVALEVNKDTDLWMRARLVSGGFGFVQTVSFASGAAGGTNDFTLLVTQPPILAGAALGYSWQFGPFHPQTVLTYNDFSYEDHSYEAIWPGSYFRPFSRTDDVTPAVYLGFDQKAPVARIGLFVDIVEQASGTEAPAFLWEYWDGFAWTRAAIEDETAELTAPGILSFIAEDDSAALARFGTALYWLRGRLKEDGPPPQVAVSGIYPNAVWALQQRAFFDVAIGTANGQPGEVFRIAQIPIIPGERLEVRELSGARSNVEWRLIALDLFGNDGDRVRALEVQLGKEALAGDVVDGDLRLVRDKQKRVAEVWVRWQSRPNLFLSSASDRHYVIDRARGLVFFGDGVNGRTLLPDAAVNVRQFKSGGGSDGNVAARTITQLLGPVSGVQAVFNPRNAEGGSDGETVEAFRLRAPASLRHRGRALAAGDYEAMVREASSAVALVKALPNRNPSGRLVPGWVTILIIPESQEPRPYPTRGLRDEVHGYLAARAPAGLAAGNLIYVTGPRYFPVDVAATLVPLRGADAGLIDAAATAALQEFLHPLHGGPSHDGWDFGRGVYLSDVATVLESVQGVDCAETIRLLVNGEIAGNFIDVATDRIVVAGMVRITVKGALP